MCDRLEKEYLDGRLEKLRSYYVQGKIPKDAYETECEKCLILAGIKWVDGG